MVAQLPQCCPAPAFSLLRNQAETINAPDALLPAAVAIAMHEMTDVDPAEVDGKIQSYADTVRSRVRGSQPQAVVAHLHNLLFDEEGFLGNTEEYYSAENSYLPAVLENKRGLPITLSLVYKLVAERVGLRSWGIGLPGHFLVGVDVGGRGNDQSDGAGTMIVDPFAGGRILTVDEAHERVQELFGPEMEWSDDLLRPASNRHWLTRMLQNLLHILGSNNQYKQVASILEMEMLLWPAQGHLQRDLALVLARIGLARPASIWLDLYLKNNPEDPQQADLKQLLDVLSA